MTCLPRYSRLCFVNYQYYYSTWYVFINTHRNDIRLSNLDNELENEIGWQFPDRFNYLHFNYSALSLEHLRPHRIWPSARLMLPSHRLVSLRRLYIAQWKILINPCYRLRRLNKAVRLVWISIISEKWN